MDARSGCVAERNSEFADIATICDERSDSDKSLKCGSANCCKFACVDELDKIGSAEEAVAATAAADLVNARMAV